VVCSPSSVVCNLWCLVRSPWNGWFFEEVVGGLGGLKEGLDPLAELVIPGARFPKKRRPRLGRRQMQRCVEQTLFAIPCFTHMTPRGLLLPDCTGCEKEKEATSSAHPLTGAGDGLY
jgi:hypothetical protein